MPFQQEQITITNYPCLVQRAYRLMKKYSGRGNALQP